MIGIIAKCILIVAIVAVIVYLIYLAKFAAQNWIDD